jgi:hypothetical protein
MLSNRTRIRKTVFESPAACLGFPPEAARLGLETSVPAEESEVLHVTEQVRNGSAHLQMIEAAR